MVIKYIIPKKMGLLISTTMIYNLLRNSHSRFTKIIISTILFWTFTKIINFMFLFKFGYIISIKLSAKVLNSKCNLRLALFGSCLFKFIFKDLFQPMPSSPS